MKHLTGPSCRQNRTCAWHSMALNAWKYMHRPPLVILLHIASECAAIKKPNTCIHYIRRKALTVNTPLRPQFKFVLFNIRVYCYYFLKLVVISILFYCIYCSVFRNLVVKGKFGALIFFPIKQTNKRNVSETRTPHYLIWSSPLSARPVGPLEAWRWHGDWNFETHKVSLSLKTPVH